MATGKAAVERLWDVCQIPDYRKIAPATHAELVVTLYGFLMREGKIPDDWFAAQVAQADRTDGDIDTLSNRIAHIRTWTFAANRPDWLADPEHWQGVTRAVEDRLSDALHERLTERFVDRRTSVLMRRLRENTMLETEISKTGEVVVEGHAIGRLDGFRFAPDATAAGSEAKALQARGAEGAGRRDRGARHQAGAGARRAVRADVRRHDPLDRRAGRQAHRRRRRAAPAHAHPRRRAADRRVARGGADASRSLAQDPHRAAARRRCSCSPPPRTSPASPAASPSSWSRRSACSSARRSPRTSRASISRRARRLRKYGVRFGAYHIYLPALLKPAPRSARGAALGAQARRPRRQGSRRAAAARAQRPHLVPGRQGDAEAALPHHRLPGLRRARGARRHPGAARRSDPAGARLARRLAGAKPAGAFDGLGFTVTGAMTSLTGSSGEDFASILRSLGYRMEKRPKPPEAGKPPEPVATTPAETEGQPAAEVPSRRLPVRQP